MDELLDVSDLMRILSISQSSAYRMVEKRIIPFYRIRSGLRFKYSDVQDYLHSCRFEAVGNEHVYGNTKD